MDYKISAILAFLMHFSLASSAISLNAPSTVTVNGPETRFFATIENTSSSELGLAVFFSSPAPHRLVNVPSTIPANRAAVIEIVLEPTEDRAGTVYASTLTARLGEETASRQITLVFGEAKKTLAVPTGLVALETIISQENTLNIALALTAAILLIAFIARFTKRISPK